MNRRSFLSSLGAVACANSLLAADAPRRIKTGFLGASHSHAKGKIGIVESHPMLELVGAAEDSETIRKAYPKMTWMSRDNLLRSCDLVFVESGVRDHGRDALEALRAGRHVHAEKPASTTLGEMTEMVRLARERNLLLQSGYM